MRCPNCSGNHKYRLGMICACGYPFVLSPKDPPFVADRAFAGAISIAGQEGTQPYTAQQVHATLFRRRNRHWWNRWVLATGTSGLGATLRAVERWQNASRDVGLLISRPGLEASGTAAWPERDLYDYGAEGVVLTNRPLLVDLLVANHVHTSAKVAIIEPEVGYPARVVDQVVALLAARPDLPIFLLHDSEPDPAMRMADRVRSLLPLDEHPIIDLGLTGQVDKLHPSMRWTRRFNVVPVDFLHPRLLTSGLAAAIARRCSLEELVHPRDDSGSAADVWWGDGDDDFG